LELSASELATITTTGVLQVGRTDGTGTLNLTQALSSTGINAGTLRLVHGNVISDSGAHPGADIGSFATPFAHNLELKANNNVQFTGNNIYTGDGKNLTISADLDNSGVGNATLGAGQFTIQVGATGANTASMSITGANVNVT